MHVDDLSNAVYKIIFLLKNNNKKLNKVIQKYNFINIGSGKDYSIKQYAIMLKKIMKIDVKFKYNKRYPDGMARKLLDIKNIKSFRMETKSRIFIIGALKTYEWYKKNV